MPKEIKIMLGIAALVIVAGIFLLFKSGGAPSSNGIAKDDARLIGTDPHQTGKAGAKVVMVEFGDYQCPACGYAYPNIKQITEQYKDQDFNFIFRNFPLTSIHKNAMASSEAAEAAGAQGKYWEMHDKLYETQNDWSGLSDPTPNFIQYAQALGLDVAKFTDDIKNNRYQDKINADMKAGNDLGVNSTPTIYVNGVALPGNPTVAAMQQEIDKDLK